MRNNSKLKDKDRQRCEVWTRVMGYHRPVSEFNLGKQAEHCERLHFKECKAEPKKIMICESYVT